MHTGDKMHGCTVFLYTICYLLRCPKVSGVVQRVKRLLSRFGRQFPITYNYIFLQNLENQEGKNSLKNEKPYLLKMKTYH